MAFLHAGPVVHAKNCIHREAGEQAFLHHLARTAAALFGGLEDQVDRAVEVAVFGQILRRRQKHGRVAVMPAGVHLAGVLAGVGKGIELLQRQCVHVGTQADGAQ